MPSATRPLAPTVDRHPDPASTPPRDAVEEAGQESFPASDAPAWGRAAEPGHAEPCVTGQSGA